MSETLYNPDFQRSILKLICINVKFAEEYGVLLKNEYFDTNPIRVVFGLILKYAVQYKKELNKEDLIILTDEYVMDRSIDASSGKLLMQEINLIFKSYIKSEQFIIDRVLKFVKQQEMKNALIKSFEILEDGGETGSVVKLINDADSVGFGENEGLQFSDLVTFPDEYRARYNPDKLIKTGFPTYDQCLGGGMGKGEVHVIMGSPKCSRKGTKIKMLDGTSQNIEDLAASDKSIFWLWACKPDGEVVPALGRNCRITGESDEFVRVTLDNGKSVDFTPGHRFLMRDGTYRFAKNLVPGDSLMPFYEKISEGYHPGYRMVRNNKTGAYRLAFQQVGKLIYKDYFPGSGYHIHHKDRNKLNDDPSNLALLTASEHMEEHKEDFSRNMKELWEREGFKDDHSERLSERNKENWKDPVYREMMEEHLARGNKKLMEDPNFHQKMSENGKKAWEDPEFRKRKIAQSKELAKERKGEQSKIGTEVMTKLWQDEGFRERSSKRSSETMKKTNEKIHGELKDYMREKVYDNPEVKKKISTKAKEKMSDWREIKKVMLGKAKPVLAYLELNNLELNEENFNSAREEVNKTTGSLPNIKYDAYVWYRDVYDGTGDFERPKKARKLAVNTKSIKRSLKHAQMIKDLLVERGLEVNEENYSNEWKSDRVKYKRSPKWERLLLLEETLEEIENPNNHKVVKVEFIKLDKPEPVYCLEVPNYNNFALDAGIFTKNSGKSTLACNIATAAVASGKAVYHVSLEISALDVMAKYAARITGMEYGDILKATITEDSDYVQAITKWGKYKPKLYLNYWTDRTVNTLTIRSWISRMRGKTGNPPDLLLIDYDDPVTGDTLIPLLDGTEVRIDSLVGKNEFWLYACKQDGEVVPGRGHSARVARYTDELIEITLDTGESIRSTPNHNHMLRDGTFKRADEFVEGDSLMPLYRRKDSLGYELTRCNKLKEYKRTHRLVAESLEGVSDGFEVHHKNHNKLDNRPENLEILSKMEHFKSHWTEERYERRSKEVKEWFQDLENRKRHGEIQKAKWTDELRDKHAIAVTEGAKKVVKRECKYCGEVIESNQYDFHSHVRKCSSEEKVSRKCKHCQNSFELTQAEFHSHVMKCGSEEIRTIVCKHCKKEITGTQSDNHSHVMKCGENVVKVYKCKYCNEDFLGTKGEFKTHQTGCKNKVVKVRECPHCKKEFEINNIEFMAHKEKCRKLVIKEYDCPTCGEVIRGNSDKIRLHKKKCKSPNNHKVVSVKRIKLVNPVPVYCLTVDKYQNYALSAGVFTHNCLLPVGGPTNDMYEDAGRIYSDLIGLASYFDVPVLTFAQPRRDAWEKPNNGECISSWELAHSAKKAHKASSISSMNFGDSANTGILYADLIRRGESNRKIPIMRDLKKGLICEVKNN